MARVSLLYHLQKCPVLKPMPIINPAFVDEAKRGPHRWAHLCVRSMRKSCALSNPNRSSSASCCQSPSTYYLGSRYACRGITSLCTYHMCPFFGRERSFASSLACLARFRDHRWVAPDIAYAISWQITSYLAPGVGVGVGIGAASRHCTASGLHPNTTRAASTADMLVWCGPHVELELEYGRAPCSLVALGVTLPPVMLVREK